MNSPFMYERNENIESEFEILIRLMSDMITAQAMANSPANPPDWSVHLHVLSMKMFKHLCSVRTLLEACPFGTQTLPRFGYIDHSSVAALTRTAIENYLVMYWLHSEDDQALREFRHMVWMYSGWKKRSKLIPTIDEVLQSHREAIELVTEHWAWIEASPFYALYSKGEQTKLRKGDWSAGTNWNELAVKAGFHRVYFTSIYPYLSGYTHTDFISCLQIGSAISLQAHYDLGIATLQMCIVMIGHFAHFYAGLFPAAKAVFDQSGEAIELATKWHIRAETMAHIYDHLDLQEPKLDPGAHKAGSE
ncbi:hypothetical protein PHLH7_03070 [Pseudomonas sp. Ost2]|uniref:DUF5677 domain-containing protein n=1 Tax=Pseudomonas TaxID=286 RepID=UPI0015A03602|nr:MULTISPECIES: DUF5677 domain-containing protein [Pseudomonas]NVZ65745.1 hypothetical protein [Pseudomonas gingeri]NVZ76973.1 hypothetical protein [Pseudomonas gingeri]BBP74203.1 hypothetical protein PHLH7_03070 [Pseudomonas sp. Ost2]